MRPQKVRTYPILTLLFVLCCCPAWAQESANEPTREELLARIRQLEARLESQNKALREELDLLKQAVVPAGRPAPAAAPAPARAASTEARPLGIGLGAVRVVPYGGVYFHLFGNSSATQNADIPSFVLGHGANNVNASGRQTRMGVRFTGPLVWKARLTGTLEADLLGGFPSIGVGEHFPLTRMRLAFARLDWEKTALVVGQDWMVFAPGNPVSLAAVAVPGYAATGNLWSRLPQLKLEQRWQADSVIWQGAILAPNAGDFPAAGTTPFLLSSGAGPLSGLPYFQTRIGLSRKQWMGVDKPGQLGASLHYGRVRALSFGAERESESFGAALDWNFPVVPAVSLAGEAFFGRNLAGFQGGVFQGFNTDFSVRRGPDLVPAGLRSIGTRGGWVQLGVTPPDLQRLSFYATYGIDDPRNLDLISLSRRDWRSRNQTFAFSFVHKPVTQISWGLEFRHAETRTINGGKFDNNHVNLAFALLF